MTQTLLVGGYGSVGHIVARELTSTMAEREQLLIAGRDGSKAASLAERLGDHASGVSFDVEAPATYSSVLEDVDQVIVCLDQSGTAFVEACLERGIDYVDVTASDEFFRQVESLDQFARENDATAVLSVGLAPGVTNLLAARAVDELSIVSDVRIGVLLGLGESFGPEASRWTLERIGRPFTVRTNGDSRTVRGFTDPRPIEFPRYGRRTAYRFDFADQHVVQRTLDVPTASTRFCFDSRLASTGIHGLVRAGVYQPMADAVGVDRLARLSESLSVGGDGFVVTVTAEGRRDENRIATTEAVDGQEQSHVTGLVAATVARAVAAGNVSNGVSHVHQILEPTTVLDELRSHGYRITSSEHVFG